MIKDTFHQIPYTNIKQSYPGLQENVYTALRDLTPGRFAFELHDLELSERFNRHTADPMTYNTVGRVMEELTGNRRLVMTSDDFYVCYTRMAFLYFIHEAEKQGVWVSKVGDEGMVYFYKMDKPPKARKLKEVRVSFTPIDHFRPRIKG